MDPGAQHPFTPRCAQPYTKKDGVSEWGSPRLSACQLTPHSAPHELALTANARMQALCLSTIGGSQIRSSFKGKGNQSFLPGVYRGVRASAAIPAARQVIVSPPGLRVTGTR